MGQSLRRVMALFAVFGVGSFGGVAIGLTSMAALTSDSCQLNAAAQGTLGGPWNLHCSLITCSDGTTACSTSPGAGGPLGGSFCSCGVLGAPTECTVTLTSWGPICMSSCPTDTYCKKSQPPSSATYYTCYCSSTP